MTEISIRNDIFTSNYVEIQYGPLRIIVDCEGTELDGVTVYDPGDNELARMAFAPLRATLAEVDTDVDCTLATWEQYCRHINACGGSAPTREEYESLSVSTLQGIASVCGRWDGENEDD